MLLGIGVVDGRREVSRTFTVSHGRILFGREDYWVRGQGVNRFIDADEFHKTFGLRLFENEEATLTIETHFKEPT